MRLDTEAGWQKGGDNGPAIVRGKPKESLLLRAIGYADEELQMPPKGKLPQAEIDILTKWIEMGAPDPRKGKAARPKPRTIDIAEGRKYWAFQPLVRVEPPSVAVSLRETKHAAQPDRQFHSMPNSPKRNCRPRPPADRRTLIRRAYLTLTGLPPTYEEVQSFESDTSPDAWEQVIDRLLGQPALRRALGPALARPGAVRREPRLRARLRPPDAYHYRDFVIKALNQDMPYDTFVRWQLAGDEIEPESKTRWR